MVDFAKARSSKIGGYSDMKKQLDKQKKSFKDERLWKHSWVKSANGETYVTENIIRLLPVGQKDLELLESGGCQNVSPMVMLKQHNFKTQLGKVFIEMSLDTFGEDCPVSEHDRPLWSQWKDAGKPDNKTKKTLMGRIPEDHRYCNIFVVKDVNAPENNGKVFLWEVPKSICDMIDEMKNPSFEGNPEIDIFDFDEGAYLQINMIGRDAKFGKFDYVKPDYKACKFGGSEPFAQGNVAIMEKAWSECHSLMEMYDRKHFKSYDELKEKFYKSMFVNWQEMMNGGSAQSLQDNSQGFGESMMGDTGGFGNTSGFGESNNPDQDTPNENAGFGNVGGFGTDQNQSNGFGNVGGFGTDQNSSNENVGFGENKADDTGSFGGGFADMLKDDQGM